MTGYRNRRFVKIAAVLAIAGMSLALLGVLVVYRNTFKGVTIRRVAFDTAALRQPPAQGQRPAVPAGRTGGRAGSRGRLPARDDSAEGAVRLAVPRAREARAGRARHRPPRARRDGWTVLFRRYGDEGRLGGRRLPRGPRRGRPGKDRRRRPLAGRHNLDPRRHLPGGRHDKGGRRHLLLAGPEGGYRAGVRKPRRLHREAVAVLRHQPQLRHKRRGCPAGEGRGRQRHRRRGRRTTCS